MLLNVYYVCYVFCRMHIQSEDTALQISLTGDTFIHAAEIFKIPTLPRHQACRLDAF